MPTKQDYEPLGFVKGLSAPSKPTLSLSLLPSSSGKGMHSSSELYLSFFIRASKTTSLNPGTLDWVPKIYLFTHTHTHTEFPCETQLCIMCSQELGMSPPESSASQVDRQH